MKTIALALAMLALVAPARVHAQSDASIELIRDGFYVIFRPEGNVGVRLAPDGVILVDEEYPEGFGEIQELIAQVSDLPIPYVVSATTTIAPERVRRYGPQQPEFQTAVHIAGVDVQAIYLGPAHTEGDAVIYFPDLRAVMGGDLLDGGAPFIDYRNGGSSAGWVESLDNLLGLEFDVAIPRHGRIMERDDVVDFRNQLEAARAHMTDLVRSGVPRWRATTRIRTPELSWTTEARSPFMRSIRGLYDEISDEIAAEAEEPTRP